MGKKEFWADNPYVTKMTLSQGSVIFIESQAIPDSALRKQHSQTVKESSKACLSIQYLVMLQPDSPIQSRNADPIKESPALREGSFSCLIDCLKSLIILP